MAAAPTQSENENDSADFDGWVPVRRLGAGAMGEVWEVRRGEVRGALKRPLDPRDPELFVRFRREAEAALALGDHPGLVGLKAIGTDRAKPFIVFELVEGEDLETRLARDGPPAPDSALTLLGQLAEALDAMHAAGCVHRDLKTANVLIDAAGRARIADLGLVRYAEGSALTETGALVGTPHAMAPEQIEGRRAGPAADRHALGVLAFELLTGERPFQGGSSFELMSNILRGRRRRVGETGRALPERADPRAVDAVFERAFARDPSARPPSARALVAELGDAVSGATPAPRARRFGRSVGLLVATALIGGLVVLGLEHRRKRARRARIRALAERIRDLPQSPSWSSARALELAVYRAAGLTFAVPASALEQDARERSQAPEVAALIEAARGLEEPDRGPMLAMLAEPRLRVAPDQAGDPGGAGALDDAFAAGLEALRRGSRESALAAFKASPHEPAARLGRRLARVSPRQPSSEQLEQLDDLETLILSRGRLADAVVARAVVEALFDADTAPEVLAGLHQRLLTRADGGADALARRLYLARLEQLAGQDRGAFVAHRLRVESGPYFQALLRLPEAPAVQLALAAINKGRARVRAFLATRTVKRQLAAGVPLTEIDPPESLLTAVKALHGRAWRVIAPPSTVALSERRRIARELPQWFIDVLALSQVNEAGRPDRSDEARLRFQLQLAPLDRRTTTLLPRQEENLRARRAFARLERERGRSVWLRLTRGLASGLFPDLHALPPAVRRQRITEALNVAASAVEDLSAAIDSGRLGPELLILARQERIQRRIDRLRWETQRGDPAARPEALRAALAKLSREALPELDGAEGGPRPWLAPYVRLQLLEQSPDAGGAPASKAIQSLIARLELCPKTYPEGDESVLRDVLYSEERRLLLPTAGRRRELLSVAHLALSRIHEAAGRDRAALAEAEVALRLNSLSETCAENAVHLAIRLERFEDARRLLGLFQSSDPTRPELDSTGLEQVRARLSEEITRAERR